MGSSPADDTQYTFPNVQGLCVKNTKHTPLTRKKYEIT